MPDKYEHAFLKLIWAWNRGTLKFQSTLPVMYLINLKQFSYKKYIFNPLGLLEVPLKLHTIKSGWSIVNVYTEGSQVIISIIYCIFFSED